MKDESCALEMCIFVADENSKYCRHHRSSMEAYERKHVVPPSAPEDADQPTANLIHSGEPEMARFLRNEKLVPMSDVPETTQVEQIVKMIEAEREAYLAWGGGTQVAVLDLILAKIKEMKQQPDVKKVDSVPSKPIRFLKGGHFNLNCQHDIPHKDCEECTEGVKRELAESSVMPESPTAREFLGAQPRSDIHEYSQPVQDDWLAFAVKFASFVTSQTHAALKLAEERAEKYEKSLRYEWWRNHGCGGVGYGDDGEMQCCMQDFKRLPMDKLSEWVTLSRMKNAEGKMSAYMELKERTEKLAAENERLTKQVSRLEKKVTWVSPPVLVERERVAIARAEKAEAENAVLRKKGE